MKPSLRVVLDGKDLTDEFRRNLIRLSIKDEAGLSSDSLEITLVNRPLFKWPAKGQKIDVFLGYDDQLTDMGSFAVKHVSARGPPHEIKIDALPIHSIETLKSQREESWDAISIPAMVEKIAKRHGLKPAVSKSFAGVMLEHEDQSESDLAFLSRIGRRYHAVVKAQGGFLLFSESGLGESATGRVIEPLRLTRFIDYEYSGADPSYTGVRASYWDKRKARKGQVFVGKEDRVHEIRFQHKSEKSARKAAESRLKKIKKSDEKLAVSVPGTTEIFAERKCKVIGLWEGIDDLWLTRSVEHILEPDGFTNRIEFEGRDYVKVS